MYLDTIGLLCVIRGQLCNVFSHADLIVEVAHPVITHQYGAAFLASADYLVSFCQIFSHNATSPVNMLDPIWKRFGYGQLWPLRPACSQNWAG